MRRRKWLALLLTVAMIATTLVTTGISSVFAADSGTYLYGDVDGIGGVTATDVGIIISNILGKDASLAEGTTGFAAADVDGIGGLTAADVGLIISKILGKLETFPADLDGDGYGPEGSVPHIATLEVSGEGGTATITNETTGTSAVASIAEAADEAEYDVEDDAEVETAAATVTQWTIEQYMAENGADWVSGEPNTTGVNECKTLMPAEEDGSDNACGDWGTVVFRNGDKIVDDDNITVSPGYGTSSTNHWHYKFNAALQMPCLQGTEKPLTGGGKSTSFTVGDEPVNTGSFMVYIPKVNGTLYVRNLVFGNKNYGVVKVGGLVYGSDGMISNPGTIDSVLDKIHTEADHPVSQSTKIDVEEGAIYYCMADGGSKIGIQGFTFVPRGATAPADDPNAITKGDAAPEPTPFVKDPTFWKASENVTTDTKEMTNDALTFMTDMTYTAGSKTIDGESFGGYISHASDNGGWSGGAATGTALKFTAPSDGKITVYMTGVGVGRPFFIVKGGTETDPKNDPSAALESFTPTDDTNRDFSLSCEVESGEVYYAYVSGSKGRFCGLKFEAGGTVEPGETTEPTPSTEPTPTPGTDPTPTPEETLPPLADNQVYGVKGDKIVINSEPEPGYKVDTITVSDGTPVKFDTADKTVASFEMPSADVTVTVTFKTFGGDSYDAVVTAEGGEATLSGDGVTPPADAASVETATWSDFDFVSVTTDDSGNTVYVINANMTEGQKEVTLDAKATYGDPDTLILYNSQMNAKMKVANDGSGVLLRAAGVMSDVTDELHMVIGVKVPYDSKLSVTAGGNGGNDVSGFFYAQTGLGSAAEDTKQTVVTVNGRGNDAYTSTEEEQYAAKKDDIVYIWSDLDNSKFRSVTFIPDSGTDPTPPSPTASADPEPTATTEPEPAGKTYTVTEGSTVTVTGTPDEAHAGQSAVVTVTTEDGAPVEVSADNTFVMPSQNVNVSVTFGAAEAGTATLKVGMHGTAKLSATAATAAVAEASVDTASVGGVSTFAEVVPPDEVWTASDEGMEASFGTADGVAFGPINGLSGYGGFVDGKGNSLSMEHNGTTYNFTKSWQAGGGSTTKRTLYFTPKQACIVTVAYTSQAGRPVHIQQNGVTLASGEEGKVGSSPATIEADIEDPNAGDVYIINGSSNKQIYAIFVDYYDPTVIVNQPVTGTIEYSGTNDTSNLKIRFTSRNEKDETQYYDVPFSTSYSTELRQQRDYDISVVDANGNKSDKVAVTLGTSTLSVKKQPVTANLKVVDIAETSVSGDIVVHDVNNDGSSLDLSGVTLTFTSQTTPEYTYTATIDAANKKLNVTLMPGETYDITAEGAEGYSLSELSKTYVMAPGDEAPFKNILFTEDVGTVEFKSEIHVGESKEYKTMTDAMTAIKAMTGRPEGESGRVTVLVDPGIYTEQLQVDAGYVTIKAADETQRPELQWYYGIGYLYYSAGDNQYYSEDYAVQKTRKSVVTRWGAACRVSGTNVNIENIIFRNTFNCFVSEAELEDGVDAANNNEYSDVNGKPERTTENYDAMGSSAVERAAAIALDGTNTELYKCDFISSQDTFYTNKNAYVKECYIEGGTDFIFGGNSILFEDCTLAWHGYSDSPGGGHLTACQTSAVPVAGTADINANGYMFKNTTLTNSKYYPTNKFAQGTWGRNWGGDKCQVVFDGVTLADGFAGVSDWKSMGGPLESAILFVTDVKKADGTPVNSDGTTFNPNGTMASKNYTMLSDEDYLGDWEPYNYTTNFAPEEFAPGTDVTLTVTPDEGYSVDTITVEGAEVEMNSNEDKTVSTFLMPAANINIIVKFKEAL